MALYNLIPRGFLGGADLKGCYKCDYVVIGGVKYLVVASSGDNSLVIINVNTPTAPTVTGVVNGAGTPYYLDGVCDVKCVVIGGNTYALTVSYTDSAFCIYNITTPASPSLVYSATGAGTPNYLDGAYAIDAKEISSNWYAFIASIYDGALTIFDIETPGSTSPVSHISGTGSPNYLGSAHDVEIVEIDSNWYALMTGFIDDSLVIIDVDTPASPTLASVLYGSGTPNYLSGAHSLKSFVSGINTYVLITGYYDHTLCCFDITDPDNPVLSSYLQGKNEPYYLGNACGVQNVTVDAETFAIVAGHLNNTLVAVDISDPTDIRFSNVIMGDGDPNYLGGIHYFISVGGYIYTLGYNEGVVNIQEEELVGDYPSMTVTIEGVLNTSAQASLGGEVSLSVNMSGILSTSSIPTSSTDGFLDEIPKSNWKPKYRVYMIDIDGIEHDVTSWVDNVGTIIWQCQQEYHIDEFTASNCNIALKNKDEKFDIDKDDNYFVSILGRPADGKHTPIQIRGGYIIDDEEILVDIFYGVIVDIDITLGDDRVGFDVSCISALLREEICVNIGDLWENQTLGGGNAFGYVTLPVGYDSTLIKIHTDPGHDGTFPIGFNESGYIQIEEEKIFYGALTSDGVTACIRGVHSTNKAIHAVGTRVDFILDDGSDTEGKIFQFPCYPIAKKSVTSVVTSDGNITILDDYDGFITVESSQKKLYAFVDYDNGWLEFGGAPTDLSSVKTTFKSVPKKITYDGLVRKILEDKGHSTTEIEDVLFSDYSGRHVSTHYGRITHAYNGNQISTLGGLSCKAIAVNDDYLYVGVGGYLVEYDGTRFRNVGFLGDNKSIVKLSIDANGNVYGVVRTDDLSSYGKVFKYDGESVTYLVANEYAAYRDSGDTNEHYGAQWKSFSVDNANGCVWFIYNHSGMGMGVAKVNFDGTGYTKYPIDTITNRSIDFVDSGNYIEVFYNNPDAFHIEYATLTKSSGTYTVRGDITSNTSGVANFVSDVTYNSDDGKIYMNEMIVDASTYFYGYFKSIDKGFITATILDRYPSTYPRNYHQQNYYHGKYSGGVYHNGYVWYVKGDEYAVGADEGDEENIDGATGHIYKIVDNIMEDVCSLGMRPPMSKHLREEVKGIAGTLAALTSEDAIYFICSDMTVAFDTTYGYSLGRYSTVFQPVIRSANLGEKSVWDVLSELAILAGYELGVAKNGRVFYRKRQSEQTLLSSVVNSSATTIPAVSTSGFAATDGKIQIDVEIISYTGTTPTSFTGCVRGQYETVAVSHPEDAVIWAVDQVLINLAHNKTLKDVAKNPNWQEIYNYIMVKYGDFRCVFDYKKNGEVWETCSEKLYGKKVLDISNNFLCNDDLYVAESIGFRYYTLFNERHTLLKSETKWQPQLELGQVLSTKQNTRVLLDYAINRIRRIEMQLGSFYVSIVSVVRPSKFRSTIYDYNYQ